MRAAPASDRWISSGDLATVLAGSLLLLAPALFNGFPLAFHDSGVYLGSFRTPTVPPFYAGWVVASSLRLSLWLTIALQALAVALWLVVISRTAIESPLRRAVFVLGIISLTPLPWLASWLMPDFLLGIGIVSALVLLLPGQRLRSWERGLLVLFVFAAAAVATANLLVIVSAGISVVGGLAAMRAPLSSRINLAAVAGALVAAAACVTMFNLAVHGRAGLNHGSPAMLFSRLADTGAAQRQLGSICAEDRFAICRHRAVLESHAEGGQAFLWEGLAEQTDAFGAGREEYAELSRRIFLADPGYVIGQGLEDASALVLKPVIAADEDPFPPMTGGDWFMGQLREHYPASLDDFSASLQQAGTITASFPLGAYTVSVFLSYLLLAGVLVVALIRRSPPVVALGSAGFAAIIVQILLNAMLVGDFARYHAKVSWIAWPLVLLSLALLTRFARLRDERSD